MATSMTEKTLSSVGNLLKLLPTGTVFLFQFLNPVLTNNGHCNTLNKYLSSILIGLSGLSCFLSSFTDSYTDSDEHTHYGIATVNGLWPSSSKVDLSGYKLRVGDFVHVVLASVVFAVVALLDNNTVLCYYPSFESSEKILLKVLPPVIGAVASFVFMVFPSKRHGIGYPKSTTTTTTTSQSSS